MKNKVEIERLTKTTTDLKNDIRLIVREERKMAEAYANAIKIENGRIIEALDKKVRVLESKLRNINLEMTQSPRNTNTLLSKAVHELDRIESQRNKKLTKGYSSPKRKETNIENSNLEFPNLWISTAFN